MAIPETDLARIRRWADSRVPAHVRDKLWIEVDVDGHRVTILECRPPWREDAGPDRFPAARLRYVAARGEWDLQWRDRNERWSRYPLPASAQVATLLKEIDEDPTCLFWG